MYSLINYALERFRSLFFFTLFLFCFPVDVVFSDLGKVLISFLFFSKCLLEKPGYLIISHCFRKRYQTSISGNFIVFNFLSGHYYGYITGHASILSFFYYRFAFFDQTFHCITFLSLRCMTK